MKDQQTYLDNGLGNARQAARELARCGDSTIRDVLNSLADRTLQCSDEILAAKYHN